MPHSARQVIFFRLLSSLVLALLCTSFAHAQASRGALTKGTFAITSVTVIPMSSDKTLKDATVLIRDGRIIAVGSNVEIPAGTRRIDGTGKFLIPGLGDMHVHLFADETPDKSKVANEFGVMLANGVTTIRLMMGTPEQLQWRDHNCGTDSWTSALGRQPPVHRTQGHQCLRCRHPRTGSGGSQEGCPGWL